MAKRAGFSSCARCSPRVRSAPLMNDFRTAGQSTERRRRMINDEGLAPTEASAPGGEVAVRTRRKSARYSQADCMNAQARITDLIPSKPLTLSLLFVAGLLAIAGLEALYYWMPRMAKLATDGRIAAFDLDSEGSLAAWFSSLMLLASGLMCLMIWSLRRHRKDDYHGRYRLWCWAACVWIVMSIDEACSLHEGFKEMMAHFTGQRLFGDGSIWWVMAYGLVLGVTGLRLLFEMRSCRTSTVFLVLAGVSWGAAIVWQLELLMPKSGARGVMAEEGCEMLGDLMLLMAFSIHARYVLRDVQGLLDGKRRTKKKKAAEEAAAAPANATGAESTSTAKPTPKSAPGAASTTQRVDPPENPSVPDRKLSKAERRQMRRATRDRDD